MKKDKDRFWTLMKLKLWQENRMLLSEKDERNEDY